MSHLEQNLLSKAGYVASAQPLNTALVAKPVMGYGGYGHAAVVIFFVLSGFLVGGKLVELVGSAKLRAEWPAFLIDRFSRIFIVLWPVLALNAAIMAALLWLVPDAPFIHTGQWTFDLQLPLSTDLSWVRWGGAAAMLNELLVPTLDSNGPLWSLAYEWCYYIMGLAAVLAYRRVFTPWALAVMLYALVLVIFSAHNQPNILFAGLSWVAGIGARIAFNAQRLRGRAVLAAGIVAVALALLADHWIVLPDPVLGLAVALMIAHPAWRRWRFGDALGERMASFSYTLYAMHFPVMLAVMGAMYAAGVLPPRLPFNATGLATVLAVLALLLLAARLFASVTEDQTRHLRRFLLGALGLRRDRASASAPAQAGTAMPR